MEVKSEACGSSSSNNNGEGQTVVIDVGRRRSSCGYCKSGFGTRINHGLRSQSLTVHDYQALLDRGWRRAGCYIYKPEMEKTCCPAYTIRLKATDFVPSKEQIRVSKRMQRFLDGSLKVKKPEQNEIPNDLNRLSISDSVNLEIRLNRSSFDQEEYELYKKYQIKVHNDTPDHVTTSSYRRFLVDSPLIFVPSSEDNNKNNNNNIPPCGFGSFHQQYLINGRLVAVGVIDILPKCLSSKYMFWDPDFAFLSLGKYSSLQEINWVKESQTHCPSLEYYYLGYYIHTCNKMRYKAAYRPSELLCPLRYQWVPFDIANKLLDKKPYVVLSDFATLQNETVSSPNAIEDQNELFPDKSNCIITPAEMIKDVSNIVIAWDGMHLDYKDVQQAFGPVERNNLESQLYNYVMVVGTDLSNRMIYSLD